MNTANIMEFLAYLGYVAAAVIALAFWPGADDPWSKVDTITAAGTIAVAASVLWVGSGMLRNRN